jgi:cytochrome c peroxidase
MPDNRRWLITCCLVAACADNPNAPTDAAPAIASLLAPSGTTINSPIDVDVRGGFVDRRKKGLTYSATFTPPVQSLTFSNGHITGTVFAPGVIAAKIVAKDAAGDTVSQTIQLVFFNTGLTAPTLPPTLLAYSDASRPLPLHYVVAPPPAGAAITLSNSTANPTTDAGATLGRVLFHDKRLSANDRTACASCHAQQFGFTDTAQFSTGFNGGKTGRHSMALANARFYARGRFFWDERAATLEDQALQPIQNGVEMGLTLTQMVAKLQATPYYAPLFQSAFGSTEITSDRVARAIAQYVRAIVSYGSRFDSTFAPPGVQAPAQLTAQEAEGLQLFNGQGRCAPCHTSVAVVSDNLHNTGLDATITDVGAGQGRFKAPSLRNVGVRGRFMHDGRFTSLEQVVDFYNTGVNANPALDVRLRAPGGGPPLRLGLTVAQRDAIVAYLRTLTDRALLSDARFANPFP